MLCRLNGEAYLDLDRETMRHVVAAVHAHMQLQMPDRLLAELGNFCAILECMIQREPEEDPNMDLIS